MPGATWATTPTTLLTTPMSANTPDALDGESLLEDVCNAIAKYCVLPGDHEYIAVTPVVRLHTPSRCL
jgi:hypothetical protein